VYISHERKEKKIRASLCTQGLLHIAIGCCPYPTQKPIPSGLALPLHNPNQVNGFSTRVGFLSWSVSRWYELQSCDKLGVSCITTSVAAE
jgi:hypothetical protein